MKAFTHAQGREPSLHHLQMAPAPIFTDAAPKPRDLSIDKKWQNPIYVNADAAAQQEPVNSRDSTVPPHRYRLHRDKSPFSDIGS